MFALILQRRRRALIGYCPGNSKVPTTDEIGLLSRGFLFTNKFAGFDFEPLFGDLLGKLRETREIPQINVSNPHS